MVGFGRQYETLTARYAHELVSEVVGPRAAVGQFAERRLVHNVLVVPRFRLDKYLIANGGPHFHDEPTQLARRDCSMFVVEMITLAAAHRLK